MLIYQKYPKVFRDKMSIPFGIWEMVLIALIALVVGLFVVPWAAPQVTGIKKSIGIPA